MELEQREFRTDPLKLRRLRIAASMSVKDFQTASGLNKDTARKVLRGDPVFLSSLSQAVHDAFNIDNPIEVLHPDELAKLGLQTEVPSPGQILEWDIDEYLSGWEKTSNGLQYQLVRLRHRYLDGRFARGKCYELRHMTSAEKERVESYLFRHAEVCEQIGGHPNIAQNLTAALVGGLWWVLDRWEDGETLADRLRVGPMGQYELRFIMTGIANGLAELHKSNVIRRELSPRSVLLRESNDRPILTDMELAKLLEGGPTVSPDEWPDDPYRALEVTGNTPIDVRADIYSWGRIFVHVATGSLCERGEEELPGNDIIPEAVLSIVIQSVELLPTDRPTDMKAIFKALKGWE
jgi:serine/threonine protein kinase